MLCNVESQLGDAQMQYLMTLTRLTKVFVRDHCFTVSEALVTGD